jgi:hypothetical protein
MNSSASKLTDSSPMFGAAVTRREAIKRAALIFGIAISPSVLRSALHAQVQVGTGPRAQFLSSDQLRVVGIIAERILPKTETPGALDAGVPAFIDVIYGQYLNADEKVMFTTGLDNVAASALTTHRKSFVQLTVGEQDELLRSIAVASQPLPKSFFLQIKELTVTGYFTSELVGKSVLKYDPVPGRFEPCIPLAEVGSAQWTR